MKSKKIELREEEFVEGLGASIEATYFLRGQDTSASQTAPLLTVTKFLETYTSEDNESFRELQGIDRAKRAERGQPSSSDALGITYSGQHRARTEAHPALPSHDIAPYSSSSSSRARTLIQDYDRSYGTLMPPPSTRQPSSLPSSTRHDHKQVVPHARSESKGDIVAANTRFGAAYLGPGVALARDSCVASEDLSGIDASSTLSFGFVPMTPVVRPEREGNVGGHDSLSLDGIEDYLASEHTMIVEPMMTWGYIAALPVLLLEEDQQAGPSGQQVGRQHQSRQRPRRRKRSGLTSMNSPSSMHSAFTATSIRSDASMAARLPPQAQDLLHRLRKR